MKVYPLSIRHILFSLFFVSLVLGPAIGQDGFQLSSKESTYFTFNKLKIKSLEVEGEGVETTAAEKIHIEPLSETEEALSKNLKSNWTWAEHTLTMIDSYAPFLFRTKKSAQLEEVKILLQVNSMGRIDGFEVLNSTDKGLRERLDHVVRKLPNCKPVPGFETYQAEKFELIIRK